MYYHSNNLFSSTIEILDGDRFQQTVVDSSSGRTKIIAGTYKVGLGLVIFRPFMIAPQAVSATYDDVINLSPFVEFDIVNDRLEFRNWREVIYIKKN